MKAIIYALRSFGRELRSGEVIVLLAAVALAVAALTAVGFLTDRIGRAVARQANEVLAADLRLRTPDPIPDAWHQMAADYGLQSAETQTFPSVVFAGDLSSLATIKGVSDGYPLRGDVRISDSLFGAQRIADGIPDAGNVWADGALMARLDVSVGDYITVGEAEMRIDAVLRYRPDQSIGFASLAPSLLIDTRDLPATGLVTQGSRVRYALLVAGEEGAVDEFWTTVEPTLSDSVRSRNREEGSDRANNAADRAQRFLSLTAVISAASVQLVLLGLFGVIVGSVVGFIVEHLVTNMLADIIQGDLPPVGFSPILLGSASALILLIGFAMPSLIQLRNTPPLRVLRHDEMPPPPSRLLVAGTSLIAVAIMLYQAIGDGLMLLIVLGGMLIVSAALYGAGRVLVAMIGRTRGGVGIAWRYGLANVSRRGRDSAVQIVAFGLGLTVLLLLTFVRTDLLEGWQKTLDENAPNNFLINIQPQERGSIAEIFQSGGIAAPTFVPMVRARMQTINGEDVKTREYPVEDGEWMANREQNLTWAETLSASNELIKGEWWPIDYDGEPLVSLEEEAAMELGVDLGDRLQYLVAGQEIVATVSSFRQVNWDSFQPNFFMVFSPGALDGYPATFVAGVKVGDEKKDVLLSLVRKHPTVSVIDIDTILEQITSIIDKASLAVQAVFVFTLGAGIAVLFAAVQSTIDERRFESAMLRALGVRRRTVLSGVLTEFAALGFAAGVLASAGASILAAIVATQLFELEYTFNPALWVAGLVGGILLVCSSGFIAARGAINAPPVDVLRTA
jgi:putative ABC transport system permease protein